MSAGKPVDLDTTPLRAPPPGVKPNFTNPESRGSEYKFLYVFILVVSAAFTFLRMYTRIWVTRCVGADDCEFVSFLSRARGGAGRLTLSLSLSLSLIRGRRRWPRELSRLSDGSRRQRTQDGICWWNWHMADERASQFFFIIWLVPCWISAS